MDALWAAMCAGALGKFRTLGTHCLAVALLALIGHFCENEHVPIAELPHRTCYVGNGRNVLGNRKFRLAHPLPIQKRSWERWEIGEVPETFPMF